MQPYRLIVTVVDLSNRVVCTSSRQFEVRSEEDADHVGRASIDAVKFHVESINQGGYINADVSHTEPKVQ